MSAYVSDPPFPKYGAGKKELDRAPADACDRPEWRDGLILCGADSHICEDRKK